MPDVGRWLQAGRGRRPVVAHLRPVLVRRRPGHRHLAARPEQAQPLLHGSREAAHRELHGHQRHPDPGSGHDRGHGLHLRSDPRAAGHHRRRGDRRAPRPDRHGPQAASAASSPTARPTPRRTVCARSTSSRPTATSRPCSSATGTRSPSPPQGVEPYRSPLIFPLIERRAALTLAAACTARRRQSAQPRHCSAISDDYSTAGAPTNAPAPAASHRRQPELRGAAANVRPFQARSPTFHPALTASSRRLPDFPAEPRQVDQRTRRQAGRRGQLSHLQHQSYARARRSEPGLAAGQQGPRTEPEVHLHRAAGLQRQAQHGPRQRPTARHLHDERAGRPHPERDRLLPDAVRRPDAVRQRRRDQGVSEPGELAADARGGTAVSTASSTRCRVSSMPSARRCSSSRTCSTSSASRRSATRTTSPSRQRHHARSVYGIGGMQASTMQWMLEMFRAPNQWRESGGKFTSDWETPEYKEAVACCGLLGRRLRASQHADVHPAARRSDFLRGKFGMYPTNFFAFGIAWDRLLGHQQELQTQRARRQSATTAARASSSRTGAATRSPC